MIFQEPMSSLNPCFTVGFQIEEVLKPSTWARFRNRAAPRARHRIAETRSASPTMPAERLSSSRTRCRAASASA
jgi:dipeptide transport system ATP-binding protein